MVKLRELIEKRIEEEKNDFTHSIVCDGHCCNYHQNKVWYMLEKLLEESEDG